MIIEEALITSPTAPAAILNSVNVDDELIPVHEPLDSVPQPLPAVVSQPV